MQDPHPLAIIPLQKNLLPSDTSSSSSAGSSPNSGTPGTNAPLVPIRALVAHKGTAAAGLNEPLRSEDDAALMRSLISLLPHERADSQVSFFLPPRILQLRDASETRRVTSRTHRTLQISSKNYLLRVRCTSAMGVSSPEDPDLKPGSAAFGTSAVALRNYVRLYIARHACIHPPLRVVEVNRHPTILTDLFSLSNWSRRALVALDSVVTSRHFVDTWCRYILRVRGTSTRYEYNCSAGSH